jgi:hypothetical protein
VSPRNGDTLFALEMDITCKDVLLMAGSALLGSIGGLFIALVLEWLKRPKLILSIADHSDQDPGNTPTRYLHVRITNRPLPGWMSWLLTRDSALSSYGRIEFFRMDGSEVFAHGMDVRWTGSPHPTQFIHNGILHWSDIDLLRYRDLHTNRGEDIDIAAKFGEETDCYAFTNTSFLHKLKHPDWRLAEGRYRLRISIFAGSYVATETFILRNDWPRTDFCLQDD